ncbi:MAG: hypothetical protein WBL87_05465 [Methanothrix sp.]
MERFVKGDVVVVPFPVLRFDGEKVIPPWCWQNFMERIGSSVR